MPVSNRRATILALAAVAGLAVPAFADRDIVFKNAGGAAANELHIVFVQDVAIDAPAPFTAVATSGQHAFTLSGASVDAGSDVTLHVSGGAKEPIRIERWWWAADGRRIGAVQHDQPMFQLISAAGGAVISFAITTLDIEVAGMPIQPEAGAAQTLVEGDVASFEVQLDCDDADDHSTAMFVVADAPLDPDADVGGGACVGQMMVKPLIFSFEGDCGGMLALTLECIADPHDAKAADVLVDAGSDIISEGVALSSDDAPQVIELRPLKLVTGCIATNVMLDAAAAATPSVLVDEAFLKALHDAWGTGDPMYDLNNDGYVDASDFHAALVSIGREVDQPAMRPAAE